MFVMRPTSDTERHRQRWRLGILVGATIIGLAEASKAYAAYHLAGTPVSLGFVLIENLPWWYLWALLIPVITWLVRRYPLDTRGWLGALAVHVPASMVIASTHLFLFSLIHYPAIARGTSDPSFLAQEQRFFSSFIFNEVLTYWGIVLGYYVLIYYRRHRRSALETAQAEARAARLEAGRIEASLNALRMELNPHFLFNALNAVSGLVRRGESATAVQMLARLGELLRTTLERRHELTIPLSEELTFLQTYLDLEQIRFQDRLQVEIDVHPACHALPVPPLILQPLVENAIRHGIAKVPGPGCIRVAGRADADRLVLEVHDTGAGIRGLGLTGSLVREGVGLRNSRARLRELYRDQATLELAPAPDDAPGTVVRLTLPHAPLPQGIDIEPLPASA